MTEKRFELTMNGNEVAQYEIIDYNQENLTVYNDLGNVYFSSAMKVCELLNNLEDENKQLKVANGEMEDYLARLEEENEQLKQTIKELEIENEAQSDAIDGLQGFITHFDLEEIVK